MKGPALCCRAFASHTCLVDLLNMPSLPPSIPPSSPPSRPPLSAVPHFRSSLSATSGSCLPAWSRLTAWARLSTSRLHDRCRVPMQWPCLLYLQWVCKTCMCVHVCVCGLYDACVCVCACVLALTLVFTFYVMFTSFTSCLRFFKFVFVCVFMLALVAVLVLVCMYHCTLGMFRCTLEMHMLGVILYSSAFDDRMH